MQGSLKSSPLPKATEPLGDHELGLTPEFSDPSEGREGIFSRGSAAFSDPVSPSEFLCGLRVRPLMGGVSHLGPTYFPQPLIGLRFPGNFTYFRMTAGG